MACMGVCVGIVCMWKWADVYAMIYLCKCVCLHICDQFRIKSELNIKCIGEVLYFGTILDLAWPKEIGKK